MSWIFLALAAVMAGCHWWSVGTARRSLEWVVKPLVMVGLIGVVATMDLPVPATRTWFLAALALCLVGDIFLIQQKMSWFIPGVIAFLAGHVFYIVGFGQAERDTMMLILGGVVIFTSLLAMGPTILGASKAAHPALPFGLAAYMITIAVMVTAAFGSGAWLAMVGSLLFAFSDGMIGFSRFVQPVQHQRLIIMTTYHVGQALLVLSLLQLS